MYGFIGFGKTTVAKKIAKEAPAVRFCIDDFNAKLFGRNPYSDGFGKYIKLNKELIWDIARETVENGINVVIENGGVWTKKERMENWKRAKQITPDVVCHVIKCDMAVARERALARTASNNGLVITEQDFDNALKIFEPIDEAEMKNYTVVLH